MTGVQPATYSTGETITEGDIVRIGNGTARWRVVDLFPPTPGYDRGPTSVSLANLNGDARNTTRWIGDSAKGHLVLMTPASEAERAVNERAAAERIAEAERHADLRVAIKAANEKLEHWWVGDDTGVMIEARDLRALLNAAQR